MVKIALLAIGSALLAAISVELLLSVANSNPAPCQSAALEPRETCTLSNGQIWKRVH